MASPFFGIGVYNNNISLFCFLKIFWSCFTAFVILDSITENQNSIPCIPALVEQSLNHGPTGKFPIILVSMKQYKAWNCEGQMHCQRFYVKSKLKPSKLKGDLNRNLEELRQMKIWGQVYSIRKKQQMPKLGEEWA